MAEEDIEETNGNETQTEAEEEKEKYKNFLIIASKKDPAGVNITTQLSRFKERNESSYSRKDQEKNTRGRQFDFYLLPEEKGEILNEENLDLEKINRYDFIIFASKHSSEKDEKTLSVHPPGNWRQALSGMGGKSWKASKTSALFHKKMFEKLNEKAGEYNMTDKYKVTLEATHHGPLIEKPCLFIEIGSSESSWNDRKAGFTLAKTIQETINEFEENPYREVAIAIGGPHYCPNFSKIQSKSNVAISHIIPLYSLPLKDEILKEAINKTQEEVDIALIDWKGIGNSEQKQKVLDILNKNYVEYRKTKDVEK